MRGMSSSSLDTDVAEEFGEGEDSKVVNVELSGDDNDIEENGRVNRWKKDSHLGDTKGRVKRIEII